MLALARKNGTSKATTFKIAFYELLIEIVNSPILLTKNSKTR